MFDLDLSQIDHHPVMEAIVDIMCSRTANLDRGFFQAETAYFIAQMASCMKATLNYENGNQQPVNVYALAMATSGYGKGVSVDLMEESIMSGFRNRFMDETFPVIAENHYWKIAAERAAKNGGDQQEEYDKVVKEARSYGAFTFVFSEGTTPAIKQMRNLLLMSGAGALCFQVDEIGLNLSGSMDVLVAMLELYDQGKIKPKLTKNTNDNQRFEDRQGKTPTNMLLFGTPSKLLDGGPTEDLFYTLLDTGYARRCIFGLGTNQDKNLSKDPVERYEALNKDVHSGTVQELHNLFENLADPSYMDWQIEVTKEVSIELMAYRLMCEEVANSLPEHEEIKRTEMSHRFTKAIKLAGAYAFIDSSTSVTLQHLHQAIKLVEESGDSFQALLTREKSYAKIAKFIADSNTEVTHVDMSEKLTFYKTATAARNEQIMLATAWGYKNGVIIKKRFIDGIEFFSGEKLKETNLDEMILSYSDHYAYGYEPVRAPWKELDNLLTADGMNWCNHTFKNEHRSIKNLNTGFNQIVVDIDGGISLETVHDLMKEYTFITQTTKRHTPENNRFRLIIPIQYELNLDRDDYVKFMEHVLSWLPFRVEDEVDDDDQDIDGGSRYPEKKWATFEHAEVFFNDGIKLLDPYPFIPRTSRNEDFKKQFKALESLDNLQRWFAQRIAEGNRNNNMIKYALALVDGGLTYAEVEEQVFAFNKMLNNPLDEAELDGTVLVTVAKRYQ